MTLAVGYLEAVLATMKRDALIFLSYRLRVFSQFLTMLFTLTLFHFVAQLVRPGAVGAHSNYYSFAVVGILITGVLTAAIGTSTLVYGELRAGTFERTLISPLGPVGGIISIAAFPVTYAIAFAGAMLAIAAGVFGVAVHPVGILPALGVTALATVALACIGLLFAAGVLAFKSTSGVTWVLAALTLLGGAYFPVSLFPGWIRWASYVQPFTPAVDLLRHLLLGTSTIQPAWLELVKLAGFGAVLAPVAVAVLWMAVNLARRRGTIMEY